MSALLWLLVAGPGLVGALLVVGRRHAERLVAPVALALVTLLVPATVLVAVRRPAVAAPFLLGQPFALRVDGLAGLVAVVVAVVALLVLAAAGPQIREARARFYGLMLLFVSSVLTTAAAASLLSLLVSWELMGATSYALIAFSWRDSERVGSANTAFLTTWAADLGLYAAAGAALAGGASLSIAGLPQLSGWPLQVAAVGIAVAALGKAAQLPFSFWLARAMQAPSTVSALLHSAAMVAMGGYLLLRVSPLLAAAGWIGPALAWVGVATAVLLGLVALGQRDLKLLLAASTASQLGFVVLAAGVGGVAAGAGQLVVHAFVKSGLFLGAGVWLELLGTRDLDRLRGVARWHPAVGSTFVVGALVLAGLPPFGLWASKDLVLAAAAGQSLALYAAGLLAAAVSAAYAGRAVGLVLRGGPPRGAPAPGASAWLPQLFLAAAAVAAGALALPAVTEAAARWLRLPAVGQPGPGQLALSAAIAVLGFGGGWLAAPRLPALVPGWMRDWLGLQALVGRLVVRPTLGLSAALARFDDGVLDAAVTRTADAGRRLGAAARAVDDGGVDAVVRRVAAGVRALAVQARRPQTGQLHHYLAMSAVALGLGVALLLMRS